MNLNARLLREVVLECELGDFGLHFANTERDLVGTWVRIGATCSSKGYTPQGEPCSLRGCDNMSPTERDGLAWRTRQQRE
jgi:hypothetical protein